MLCRASGEGCSEQHAARRLSPKGDMRGEMSVRWLSLTPEDYRRMPWKNGGGVTEEIALDPPGGHWEGPSRILWRVSTALVASSGPFSLFPGYDRFLAVVDGGALELHVEGREPERLHPRGGVCAFSGDVRTEGILLEGPCRDFNLFVDRSRGSAASPSRWSARPARRCGAIPGCLCRAGPCATAFPARSGCPPRRWRRWLPCPPGDCAR